MINLSVDAQRKMEDVAYLKRKIQEEQDPFVKQFLKKKLSEKVVVTLKTVITISKSDYLRAKKIVDDYENQEAIQKMIKRINKV